MKKQQVSGSLWGALRAALKYWAEQAASRQAMGYIYERKWRGEELAGDFAIQILINPQGSIYKVTHRHFLNGRLLREESYLATYAWHSNGHLFALGSDRCLVFDPAQRQLYLEERPETGGCRLETFEQL
jgi:hypothetical protein